MNIEVPSVRLNSGVEMPQIGLGLGNGLHEDDKMLACVSAALDAGYRSFDTATRYRNERGLGRALASSGIPRGELFVTTKVWATDHGRDATLRAFSRSIEELGLDYADLYLIHFPAAALGLYVETWLTLEELYRDGRARAIGVANFLSPHLTEIMHHGSVIPAVNQVELHPRFQQRALRAFNDEHGIRTEAWSPLGMGGALREQLFASIAAKHGATPAQIILRWHLHNGTIVIPRSTNARRIRENIEALNVGPLDGEDLAAIDALDSGGRIGPDPDEFFDGPFDMRTEVAKVYEPARPA